MSKVDVLKRKLNNLENRHKELDLAILECYNSSVSDQEVRKMKTMKLYLKDEIHRINQQLIQMVLK
jgi:hypothetical protein|tara:strand:+ start:857 stop:1054 length:198 start_codon:yes stop_codon:yes gene_type:complete